MDFRAGREGDLRSPRTLEYYDGMLVPFLDWAAACGITTFAEVEVRAMRAYRLHLATRAGKHGRRLSSHTVLHSHTSILSFMRWADAEGYDIDVRILDLPRPKVSEPEPDVFHMDQLRSVLEACNPALPQEALAVRILVGSGLRASELCGLAVAAPDGMSDVLMDRLPDGVELRVRWRSHLLLGDRERVGVHPHHDAGDSRGAGTAGLDLPAARLRGREGRMQDEQRTRDDSCGQADVLQVITECGDDWM
jgi:integrase